MVFTRSDHHPHIFRTGYLAGITMGRRWPGATLDELAALGEELLAGLARMREDVDAMGRSLTALEQITAELRQDVTRLGERVDRLELRIDGIEARLERIEFRLGMEAR